MMAKQGTTVDMSERQGVGIVGVGKYVPTKLITNEQVEAWTNIPANTIFEKTGITKRYIVDDNETASGMSATAAQEAIAMAGIKPEQIGLIIGCTFTGDYVYPAMACKIQDMIGARNAGAFDLMANCTGFQVGIGVASDRMYCDSTIQYALVIGTALQSRYINWKDPNSAIYFGDGAGAAVLGKVQPGCGVLATEVSTNGRVFEAVRLRGGGSSFPLRSENINEGLQYYEINGLEVWKQAVQYQPAAIRRSLEKIGKKVEDVDFFIFHQANLRLIEYLMGKMKQPMSKTLVNVTEIGNTADASLAIALCDAVRGNCIRSNDLIVISGVGAGFTFGSTVIRWH
jgi:3-oxoacyl-[acyl-carrier-protein] synthase-3